MKVCYSFIQSLDFKISCMVSTFLLSVLREISVFSGANFDTDELCWLNWENNVHVLCSSQKVLHWMPCQTRFSKSQTWWIQTRLSEYLLMNIKCGWAQPWLASWFSVCPNFNAFGLHFGAKSYTNRSLVNVLYINHQVRNFFYRHVL